MPLAFQEFDAGMPSPNQINLPRDPSGIVREDLLSVPVGTISMAGVRSNLSVGLRYMAAWLCGNGCVPIDHLMEDAATAEISRSQLWQWRRHEAQTVEGLTVDSDLLRTELAQTLADLRADLGDIAYTRGRFGLAGELFEGQILAKEMPAFLTLEAYEHLAN
jgi:malate synthase